MDVFRTLAEAEARSRHSWLARRDPRTHPAGTIHAAAQQGETTLCGRVTGELFEFGRSRHPFERTPEHIRCPICNELAGRPMDPTDVRVTARLASGALEGYEPSELVGRHKRA
jgi:hypothetical protein